MLVILKRDSDEISLQAAQLVASAVRKKPALTLGLATGGRGQGRRDHGYCGHGGRDEVGRGRGHGGRDEIGRGRGHWRRDKGRRSRCLIRDTHKKLNGWTGYPRDHRDRRR